MSSVSEHEERDAVDLVTDCMYAVGFLVDATNLAFHPDGEKISVKKFFDTWHSGTGRTKLLLPFNPGVILAFLYVGILFPKEMSDWYGLVPDDELPTSDPSWGLAHATVISPKHPKPTVKDCVRRIRNSLGHASPKYNMPTSISKGENILEKVTLTFKDVNMRDQGDTFEVTLNLSQCLALVKKFQSVVHKHVRDKYGLQAV